MITSVAVVFCLLSGPVLAFLMPLKADIDPNDKLIFVGETVKLQCRLRPTATEFNSSGMYMTIQLKNGHTLQVPNENVTVVDDKTIHAVISITESFQSMTTIRCAHGNTTLRSVFIYIERPLLNVQNFSGTYFYDNSSIITRWSLGQTYLSKSIGVVVDWNPFAPPDNGHPCNVQTLETCVIDQSYGQESIFFRVNVSILHYKRPNSTFLVPIYPMSVSSVFKFVLLDNLKTGPAENVTVLEKNSTCASLIWKMPKYFNVCYRCNSFYRLGIKTQDDVNFTIAVDSALKLRTQETVQVCGLTPDTTYALRLQIKAFESNPWSEPITIEFRSDEDRPLTGPPVTDTGYSAEECVGQKRNVRIYWDTQPKESSRGRITRFKVKIGNVSMSVRPSRNYFDANLKCDSTHEVKIFSATRKGLSLEPSVMVIPKESEEIVLKHDLMFRVEETGDEVFTKNATVTWKIEEPSQSLVLVTCQEAYKPFTCLNGLKTFEVATSDGTVLLSDLPATPSIVGYALKNDKGQKRGIRWANCVYRADVLPPAIDLQVGSDGHPGSLLISWTSPQCNRATKAFILRYHLAICLEADCRRIQVDDAGANTHTAKGLLGGKLYNISIQAESLAGKGPLRLQTGIPQSDQGGRIYIGSVPFIIAQSGNGPMSSTDDSKHHTIYIGGTPLIVAQSDASLMSSTCG